MPSACNAWPHLYLHLDASGGNSISPVSIFPFFFVNAAV